MSQVDVYTRAHVSLNHNPQREFSILLSPNGQAVSMRGPGVAFYALKPGEAAIKGTVIGEGKKAQLKCRVIVPPLAEQNLAAPHSDEGGSPPKRRRSE